MPRSSFDWHSRAFKSAEFWRGEAVKWEKLADMAKADGDERHESNARDEAANCRQNARLKELAAATGGRIEHDPT